jgi:uncharacterized protein YacL
MYPALLHTHNLLRWVVLIVAVLALVQAYRSWRAKAGWSEADTRAGRLFTVVMDVQLLVGLLLYGVFSPLTTAALANFGVAVQNAILRFFLIEHIAVMILAVVLAHVGFSLGRKQRRPATAAVGYALAIVLVLAAIPWPGLIYGRPLLPGL